MQLSQTFDPYKNISYIIVSIQNWNSSAYNPSRLLAKEIARHNEVLYINPGQRSKVKLSYSERIESPANHIKLFTPATYPPSKWYLNIMFFFKQINRHRNITFAREILYAINKLEIGNFVLLNINDLFRSYYLKELTAPLLSVYYISQNSQSEHHWYSSAGKLNYKLIKKADLVFSANDHLTEIAQKHNKNTFHIGESFDIDLFRIDSNLVRPQDIREIKGPIAGFIGDANHKNFDYKLFESVVSELQNWNFVIINLPNKTAPHKRLSSFSNVHILQFKPISLLPSYINSFDVCICPFLKARNSAFLNQSIAMGKPCVVKTHSINRQASQFYYDAENMDDFVKAIQYAYTAENSSILHRRVSHAKSNSWKRKAELIIKLINDQIKSRNYFSLLKKAN